MRKNRVLLYVFSVLLFAVVGIIFFFQLNNQDDLSLLVSVRSGNTTENINCWENSTGDFYIFMPSYANLCESEFVLNTDNKVEIGNKAIYNGMICEGFELNKEYDLEYSTFWKRRIRKITFLKSENLPTLYINTESGNMDYIDEEKGNKESGKYKMYAPQGEVEFSGELESIGGRGNSTWTYYDKKPYNLTFSSSVNLLNMGESKQWVLLSNATDSSNIRNMFVYEFADRLQLLSPQRNWVDLYLNGEYAGLYLLCRRNSSYFEAENGLNNDGFLVSLENEERLVKQNIPYIVTEQNQSLRIHSATISNEEISKIWQSAENAIVSDNGVDSITNKHWSDLIDKDSWVKKYLLEEVFGNLDACYLSQFFYYGKDTDNQKIFAGPVWDYDMTMGNKLAWSLGNTDILVANRLEVGGGDLTPWYSNLYNDKEFYNEIKKIYKEEFLPEIQYFLDEKILEYSKKIASADVLDRIRWSEYRDNNLDEEINYIKNYMTERLEFLSELWLEDKEFVTLRLNSGSKHYGYWKLQSGETVNEVPKLADTVYEKFVGWYYEGTNEPFDINKPIYEDTEIYAKWQDSAYKKTEQIVKLIPIGIIAVIFLILFFIEFKRIKGKR